MKFTLFYWFIKRFANVYLLGGAVRSYYSTCWTTTASTATSRLPMAGMSRLCPLTILYTSPLISCDFLFSFSTFFDLIYFCVCFYCFSIFCFINNLMIMNRFYFVLCVFGFWKQQQVQCGIWVREHDLSAGDMETVQGVSSSKLGSVQFQENLWSHICQIAGIDRVPHALQNNTHTQLQEFDLEKWNETLFALGPPLEWWWRKYFIYIYIYLISIRFCVDGQKRFWFSLILLLIKRDKFLIFFLPK